METAMDQDGLLAQRIAEKLVDEGERPDTVEFLKKMFKKLPKLAGRFEHFLDMDANDRLAAAQQSLNETDRTGFTWALQRAGLPSEEPFQTVGQHTDAMIALAGTLTLPENVNRQRLNAMLRIHDAPEGPGGDLVKYPASVPSEKYKFEDGEKARLEALAAALIFENHPEEKALYQEYEADKTATAHWAHAIDALEMVQATNRLEEKYPGNQLLQEEMDVFWSSAEAKIRHSFKSNNGSGAPQAIQEKWGELESRRDEIRTIVDSALGLHGARFQLWLSKQPQNQPSASRS